MLAAIKGREVGHLIERSIGRQGQSRGEVVKREAGRLGGKVGRSIGRRGREEGRMIGRQGPKVDGEALRL